MLGEDPTLTGTSWIVCPEPSPSEMRSRRIPTSPATASDGGLTKIVTVESPYGSTESPF